MIKLFGINKKIFTTVMIASLVLNYSGISFISIDAFAETREEQQERENRSTRGTGSTEERDQHEERDDRSERSPTPTPTPTKIPTPKPTKVVTPTPTPTVAIAPKAQEQPSSQSNPAQQNNSAQDTANGDIKYTNFDDETGNQEDHNNFDGPVTIETGDADVVAGVQNNANTNNYSGSGMGYDDTVAVIDKNGAGSDNDIEVIETDTTELRQDNELYLDNNVDVDAVTGNNTIKNNLGGKSTIKTGDASALVNVFNFGNTNFANVSLSELDIDDAAGDVYLDSLIYSAAKELRIDENGADSKNGIILGTDKTQLVFQDNYAEVNNDINIEVNTGDNEITKSLGDAAIETGDASVVANIMNFLNTNFVGLGDLLVGVLNIGEGYKGNIYLPTLAGANTSATIAGNGTGSMNETTISDTDTFELLQQNNVEVNNTVNVDATTGKNDVSKNVGDSIAIETGSVDSHITATTIAGQNFYQNGGYVNLVFLNKKGVITPYYVDAKGNLVEVPQVYADTTENGAYSENIIAVSDNDTTKINQVNTAKVNNNLNIDANTGNNSITKNVDSGASVKTGDVSVMASITNFIGNNFVGDNLMITFINDLGDWTGSILPGWMKNTEDDGEKENMGGPIGQESTNGDKVPVAHNDTSSKQNETSQNTGANTTSTADGNDSVQNAGGEDVASQFEQFAGSAFSLLGTTASTDDEQGDGDGSALAMVGATEGTSPIYRPTISTEGAPSGLINLENINPLTIVAVAGLIIIANYEIKRRFDIA